jgi:hypothetical protein
MDVRRIRRLLRESSEAEARADMDTDSEADSDADSETGLSGLDGLDGLNGRVVPVRMMNPPPRRGAYDA